MLKGVIRNQQRCHQMLVGRFIVQAKDHLPCLLLLMDDRIQEPHLRSIILHIAGQYWIEFLLHCTPTFQGFHPAPPPHQLQAGPPTLRAPPFPLLHMAISLENHTITLRTGTAGEAVFQISVVIQRTMGIIKTGHMTVVILREPGINTGELFPLNSTSLQTITVIPISPTEDTLNI